MKPCPGKVFLTRAAKLITAFAVLLLYTGSLLLPPSTAIAGIAVFRLLAARSYSIRFSDSSGNHIGTFPTAEGEWRMRIPGTIPEKLKLAFTAVEDWRFREHCGIDFAAVLRASFQNFTSRSIVSGASTVTMQLARCLDYRGRSWQNKIRESLRALALERHLSKDTILRLYLDNLPFGGRIYGVETAAQYYFSATAEDLTWAQLSVLAGIPQRPNAFRPDKYPDAAAKRRQEVLNLFVYHNVISPAAAAEIAARPLFIDPGDYSGKAASSRLQSQHFCRITAQHTTGTAIKTTLTGEWQNAVVELTRKHIAALENVNDCAIVVVNNHDLTVPVLTGGIKYDSPAAGMVNSATARRSPGSLLKPFIYGCAIKKGLIVPETVVLDEQTNIHGYVPENFSREFTGRTTAALALASSLNIPAVTLLSEVGVPEWQAELRDFGFTVPQGANQGLSAALGGGMEISPLEAAEAFAALANGGVHGKLRFTTGTLPPQGSRIWSKSAAFLVNSMLRRPLPGAPEADAAWKTGTSQGRRDAWCAAWDRDFTVVVWVGNKSGTAASGLVGVEAAAPLAGSILTMLHNSVPASPWPPASDAGVGMTDICGTTGLRAWTGCSSRIKALAAEDIPLRPCRKCSTLAETPAAEKLLQPRHGTFYTDAGGTAKIDFEVTSTTCPTEVLWYRNGQFTGERENFTVRLPPGNYTVTAFFPSSGRLETVKFQIIRSSRQ